MSVIYKFLFPSKPDGTAMSLLILALRILFGILLMSHGVQKWANYDVMSGSFPDPLGIGSQLSLVLAIFGEMVCSMAFIFGFLYRLAMLPMIFTMCIAFFVVHGSDQLGVNEDNTYMFIQGHHIMDSVVMRLLVPVCNVLRRERETEIKELAEHNMQFHNELTSYQRRQLGVDIVLRKHTSYKLSPLYKKLEADIERFLKHI